MHFALFKYLGSLAFIYIYGRLAIHFVPMILHYFLNTPSEVQMPLEKSRMLFHITGLSAMHLIFIAGKNPTGSELIFQPLILAVFCVGIFFCHLTWTKKFERCFLPQPRKTTNGSNENFKLSISDSQLIELYHDMVRFDLMDQDATSEKDFKKVLLMDWNSHESKIYLKMDGPSCREFYDHFTKTFPANSMTLKNLFITSGLILRPDGRMYNYNTLKNAPTRTPVSKQHETLVSIFDKLDLSGIN